MPMQSMGSIKPEWWHEYSIKPGLVSKLQSKLKIICKLSLIIFKLLLISFHIVLDNGNFFLPSFTFAPPNFSFQG